MNDNLLNDNDFHIRFRRNVLRYKRKVEYCQWIESIHVQTDNRARVNTKTYSYVQSWLPNPILSLYYNESFSHVNPQRHPYSSKTVTLPQAKIGKLIFNENLIEQLNSFKNMNDDNDMFIESAGKYASAYNEHQFEYIGNGYFYSQYEQVILNSRSRMNTLQTKTRITGTQKITFYFNALNLCLKSTNFTLHMMIHTYQNFFNLEYLIEKHHRSTFVSSIIFF